MLISSILLIVFCLVSAGHAAGTKPSQDKHPIQTARKNADEALDQMSQGLRQALRKAKKGANEALDQVDKSVHQLLKK